MDLVLYNLRLKELVAVVKANRQFYEDFTAFLQAEGYGSVLAFIQESLDEKAADTIAKYLISPASAHLYDGILRPYPTAKAKWYFLAWLMRDAATQRLQPLLSSVPGNTDIERKTFLINELRKFVAPLFTLSENWEWPAVSEVLLARLEGSRRALRGTLFEGIVRRSIEQLISKYHLPLTVSPNQVRLLDETYDIQVQGGSGTLLVPVKTRETMGGGHALLFTRDIYKSIAVATEHNFRCVPIVIAESWSGDLVALKSELFIYIQANPNQVAAIEPILSSELEGLLPLFSDIS